jgi:hypothetical protein
MIGEEATEGLDFGTLREAIEARDQRCLGHFAPRLPRSLASFLEMRPTSKRSRSSACCSGFPFPSFTGTSFAGMTAEDLTAAYRTRADSSLSITVPLR